MAERRPNGDEKLITDLPLIKRYSRSNEAADWRFRDHVKHRLNMSNVQLDAIVQEVTDDVWSRIDCLSCGNCCKTLQITVDRPDVLRLAKRLGVSEKQFARDHVRTDRDGVTHLLSGPCRFLGDDNKCSVYEDRPQACRDFPYLREPDFRSRSISMIENAGTCPIVFNVLQILKRKLNPGKR
ncbi:MAG TPA: YkgJ family cysteine cluster protein [Capsulimonadaceae bacterium]|jgi:hypothetical protein